MCDTVHHLQDHQYRLGMVRPQHCHNTTSWYISRHSMPTSSPSFPSFIALRAYLLLSLLILQLPSWSPLPLLTSPSPLPPRPRLTDEDNIHLVEETCKVFASRLGSDSANEQESTFEYAHTHPPTPLTAMFETVTIVA